MVTEAHSYLFNCYWAKQKVVYEYIIDASSHVMTWSLHNLYKSKVLKGFCKVHILVTYVTIYVSTDDCWFGRIDPWQNPLIERSIAITSVHIYDFKTFIG